MIEASENIDLVTLRRSQDLATSQRAASETATLSAPTATDTVVQDAVAPAHEATAATLSVVPGTPSTEPLSAEPATDTGGLARIVITAALVVVLFVVWAFQKRSARAS